MEGMIIPHNLAYLLATYGYLAVFLLIAVESTGIPVPGESMLVAASIYAGTTHRLSVGMVIAAAAVGAMVGDNVGFTLGRQGGVRLLRRYGRYIRLDEQRLQLGHELFRRHGGKVVFFGRFVPVLRMWAAFFAGAQRMPWKRFLAFNAAGGLAWAAIVGSAAYLLGESAARLGGLLGLGLAVVMTAATAIVTVAAHRKEQQLAEGACRHDTVSAAA